MYLLIGTSLSMCVSQILKGEVKLHEVFGIVSSTCIRDDISMIELMESYAESAWYEYDWDDFEPIVWELFHNRYFEQPRLTAGFPYIGVQRGLWMKIAITRRHHIFTHSHIKTTASGICLCEEGIVTHIDYVDGDRWVNSLEEMCVGK